MTKRVQIPQNTYYDWIQIVSFMAEPFISTDAEAFANVQKAACELRDRMIKVGDDQLIPRVNPRREFPDRRINEYDRRRMEDEDANRLEESLQYLRQVREEKG